MSNPSAMLLVLVVFLAMFLGALIIILVGGGMFRHSRNTRHQHVDHHRQRAA